MTQKQPIDPQSQALLYDRSNWGVLEISGADRLRFLHNQSTNDIQSLKPGQGCDTVFVTSTARTIDLATAYLTEEAILVLISANRRQPLVEWLDQYIFPMDQVSVKDVTQDYGVFNLIGSNSEEVLKKQGADLTDEFVGQPAHHQPLNHRLFSLKEMTVRIATGSGLAVPGYTLILQADAVPQLWQSLVTQGAVPIDHSTWEQLRIQQGRPTPDFELTEDYNPLEAGLWHTISFDKGCYIGQETIARLNTYGSAKQRLFGIRLSKAVEPGTVITLEGQKIGVLTSYTLLTEELIPEKSTEDQSEQYFSEQYFSKHLGLGYIRTKAGGAGLKVQVGDAIGEVVEIPFVSHQS